MNRKTQLLVRLVVLVILLLVFGNMAIRLLWGTGMNHYSTENGLVYYKNDSELYGTLYDTKTFSDVSQIEIELNSSAVYLNESSEKDICIDYYKWGMKTPKFSELQGEDSLIIKQESNGIGLMGGSYIIISVPKSIMRNYKISTASGSLHFNVPSEDASLYTASGSIKVNSVVETLKVKTSSGSIKIYEGGNSIDAKTASGSIKIYQPYQEITAKTSSGSIKLTVNSDSKEVNAKTSSGSIKIRQQDKVNYSMEYDTNSGSVKDDYLGITYDHSGKIEQPNSVLSIDAKTNSGSIKLVEWNDNY